MMLDQIFTLAEALDILGLLQCVFILTIVILKAADVETAVPTVAFFAGLGLAFGLSDDTDSLAYAMIPALSYLLILQVAFGRLPQARHLSIIAVPLLGPLAAAAMVVNSEVCTLGSACPEFVTFTRVFVVVPGAFVLLVLWLQRGLLMQVWKEHGSHDRYWVVMTLIAFNVMNLGVDLARVGELIGPGEASLTRTILGLTFVYLVTTLAFRIDPKLVVLLPGVHILRRSIKLTLDEQGMAERIRNLMNLDKLYQEPTFSRADLAHELNVSEDVVSRVINGAFRKSFRQLLNEYRIDESKQLLRDTDYSITQIAADVGFGRHTSFNRVFKQVTGQSPTQFRAAAADAKDDQAAEGEPGDFDEETAAIDTPEARG